MVSFRLRSDSVRFPLGRGPVRFASLWVASGSFSAALLVLWRGLAWALLLPWAPLGLACRILRAAFRPLAPPCLAFAFALGSFGACLPTFIAALLVLWRGLACPLAPLGLALTVALGSFGARALLSEMPPKPFNPRHFGRVCIRKRCSPEPAGRKSRNSLPIYSYYSSP